MQNTLGGHSQAHEIASQHMCPFCVTRVWNKLRKSVYLQDPLCPSCRPLVRAALEHLPWRHRHRGGYPSQVESVGTTVRAPKSLKWNLHKESSDAFRMVRASSLELRHKPKRQFVLQIPTTALFFCSLLLECDLLAKKVPGRAPYSQHIMIRNWT